MSYEAATALQTTRHAAGHDVQKVMALIGEIDLTMVKAKLMDEEEGQGWTQGYVDAVEHRYRRYLCMVHLSQDGSVVPTRDIDLFWHQHILDTRAYAKDCELIFGEFLHHYPYFGMNGPEDERNLLDSFEETKETWELLFGEPYCADIEAVAGRCHDGGTSKCHKCSKDKPVSCHKCQSKPGPDTIKCTRCKNK